MKLPHWTKDIALLTEREEQARKLGGRYGLRGVPIERDSMPSSYAVAAVINGEDGSWVRLLHVTFVRALFMVPFVWGTGRLMDIKQLRPTDAKGAATMALFALGMSVSQSVGLLGVYGVKSLIDKDM